MITINDLLNDQELLSDKISCNFKYLDQHPHLYRLPTGPYNLHFSDFNSVKISEIPNNQSVIIADEVFEFSNDPGGDIKELMNKLVPYGKLYIRFRPWTACHGGFQHPSQDPYGHLLAPEEYPLIKMRMLRPRQTYNNLLKPFEKKIITRRVVHSAILNDVKPILRTLSEKLFDNVFKDGQPPMFIIGAIQNVDYVLQK
jgi:hypothetical protein